MSEKRGKAESGGGMVAYISWEEDGAWLGYLREFPDYWTQGETLDDLTEHLRDLYADLIDIARPRDC